MRKIFNMLAIMGLLFFSACSKNNPEDQMDNLNGYWEIKSVDSPYGNDKEYSVNETVDYIEIKDSTGFRAKVLPSIDGNITSNGNIENVQVSIKNDSLYLSYSTDFDKWTETVLEATSNILKVKNQRGIIYTYARYAPIDLGEDGLLEEQ